MHNYQTHLLGCPKLNYFAMLCACLNQEKGSKEERNISVWKGGELVWCDTCIKAMYTGRSNDRVESTRCDEPKCNRPMPFDIQSPTAKLMILNVLLAEKICRVILSWRGSVWLRLPEKTERAFERIHFPVEWFHNKEFNSSMIKAWRHPSSWNNKHKNLPCVNRGDVPSNLYKEWW